MKSPADMKIIQIELTNACTKRCANCTRFCGHHAEPFFMDFETFKRAVDSMNGFKGIVGIMGGEPTIHPEFEKFVQYYKDHFGYDDDSTVSYGPTSDFIGHILSNAYNVNYSNHRGLWTSVGSKYYEHFELIQDTFGYQLVNDHSAPSMHETLMATRRELGIPDEKWFELRDKCWIQNLWSASITPKGAFFCEIAAAMDATLGGPGGWPIEPGWWKRTPDQFQDQLHWCEMCSAALPMPKRNANEETDDVSPFWLQKLKEINSPKLRRGLVAPFDPLAYDPNQHEVIQETTPYLDDQALRIGAAERLLRPQKISHVLLVGSKPVDLPSFVKLKQGGHLDMVAGSGKTASEIAHELDVTFISLDSMAGPEAYDTLQKGTFAKDWILLMDGGAPAYGLFQMLATCVFNPGSLHWRGGPGGFHFFNVRANALRHGGDLYDLRSAFPSKKIIHLERLDPAAYRMSGIQKFYRRGIKRVHWASKRLSLWMARRTA